MYGHYPDIGLAEARKKHLEARNNLANDIDPSALKQRLCGKEHDDAANTFKGTAERWIAVKSGRKSGNVDGEQQAMAGSPADVLAIIRRRTGGSSIRKGQPAAAGLR